MMIILIDQLCSLSLIIFVDKYVHEEEKEEDDDEEHRSKEEDWWVWMIMMTYVWNMI